MASWREFPFRLAPLRERLRKSGKLLFEFTDALRDFVFQIFADCSGGNSSPSHPADAGGCIFLYCFAAGTTIFFGRRSFFLSYDATLSAQWIANRIFGLLSSFSAWLS